MLHPDAEVAARLERFIALVIAGNTRVRLTGARDRDGLAEQIRDCLTLLPWVDGPLVDIGSGGGLPGIPLAIAAGVPVTLIEATVKKARFLEETLAELGLEGAVVAARAEVAGRSPALRERFRAATARAVGSLPTCLELTVPFLATGGRALLQRGRLEADERAAGVDAALMLGAAQGLEIPAGDTRLIAIFEKRNPTPARFPRRSGVPEKRPLCLAPRTAAGTVSADA